MHRFLERSRIFEAMHAPGPNFEYFLYQQLNADPELREYYEETLHARKIYEALKRAEEK